MGITTLLFIALLITSAVAFFVFRAGGADSQNVANARQKRICYVVLAAETAWLALFFCGAWHVIDPVGTLFLPVCLVIGICGVCYPTYLLLKKAKCTQALIAFILGLFIIGAGIFSFLISLM